MPRPSSILWDIFYTYFSLLDCLRFLLILLDEFLYCSRGVSCDAVDKIHSPP